MSGVSAIALTIMLASIAGSAKKLLSLLVITTVAGNIQFYLAGIAKNVGSNAAFCLLDPLICISVCQWKLELMLSPLPSFFFRRFSTLRLYVKQRFRTCMSRGSFINQDTIKPNLEFQVK